MNITYNKTPSKYELEYIKWNGINFDREILIKFIKRLKLTFFLSFIPQYKREHKILKNILSTYDDVRIKGLLNNDENIVRLCFIEKWARIAATDILLTNVYSRETFTTISNLPIRDYQLLLKRTEELIISGRNLAIQSNNVSNDIPGL
jgi:hypothetical protein